MFRTQQSFVIRSTRPELNAGSEGFSQRIIHMGARHTQAFLAALDSSLPPNVKLTAALHDCTSRRNGQAATLDWAPRQKRV
jgi:uncharacterized protein (DUF1778 family)